MAVPSAGNGKSLEERANDTKEKGRLLAETFNQVRYIHVSGYAHNSGDSFSIVYDRDEAFQSDWETLKNSITANLNGLRAEVILHGDEQLYPPINYQTKNNDATKLEILIRPADRVTDAYAREEIISKVIKKITAGITDYLEKHPNAVKKSDN